MSHTLKMCSTIYYVLQSVYFAKCFKMYCTLKSVLTSVAKCSDVFKKNILQVVFNLFIQFSNCVQFNSEYFPSVTEVIQCVEQCSISVHIPLINDF